MSRRTSDYLHVLWELDRFAIRTFYDDILTPVRATIRRTIRSRARRRSSIRARALRRPMIAHVTPAVFALHIGFSLSVVRRPITSEQPTASLQRQQQLFAVATHVDPPAKASSSEYLERRPCHRLKSCTHY